MDRYYSQTIGTEIFSENGVKVGRVAEVLTDTDKGKVVGFLLAPQGKKVLSPRDILLWNRQLVCNDSDDILDWDEIITVKSVYGKNIPIIKNKVVTEKGEYLGHVFDYVIDNKVFMMTKILVAKNLLGLFPYDEKIVAHKNIIEITKEHIVVKNPTESIRVNEKKQSKQKDRLNIDPAPTPS